MHTKICSITMNSATQTFAIICKVIAVYFETLTLFSCSLGKLGECTEEPGQDGGGGDGVQERAAPPREHGRHAVQPVSVKRCWFKPSSCLQSPDANRFRLNPIRHSRLQQQEHERQGVTERVTDRKRQKMPWQKIDLTQEEGDE